MGNILTATRNGVTTSYTYDNLGQLTRVDDPSDTTSGSAGTTWVYDYDRGGNILTKKRYAYTTGTLGTALETVTYSYNDSNWKDKMTAYNGTAISYDSIGNPIYDGTWSYTWEKGRQLKQMSKSGTTAAFLYNADGLRIRKTVNGVVTNYTLHGKNIVHLTQGSNNLHFFYDAQNRPAVVNFNGTKYGYIVNLQGDVLGLIDSTGAEVVKYTYDAWGKVLSTTGSLASTLGTIQPFRYRGYVYDVETGLYYLRARYYNPVWQRFINADTVLVNKKVLLSHNSYHYCANNPIVRHDPNGSWFFSALCAGVAALAEVVGIVAVSAAVTVAVVAVAAVITEVVDLVVDAAERIIETVTECYDVATTIVSAVEIAEEASEKRTYYNNSIYVLKNNQDEVRYVGITNDVGRRKYEHEHDPRHPWRANYKMFVVATGLSREAARTGEQVLISAYTLNALENARREIAVGNVPKFSHHLSTVAELLKIDEIPIALLK